MLGRLGLREILVYEYSFCAQGLNLPGGDSVFFKIVVVFFFNWIFVNLLAENVTYTLKIAEKRQIYISEALIPLMDA